MCVTRNAIVPPPKRPWFRFYTEAPGDMKLRRLTPEHRWLWVCVLSAARQSPVGGTLLIAEDEPMTVADLADYAALSAETVVAGMTKLAAVGMVARDEATGCWSVPKFSERQYESDSSSARTAKWRSKKRHNDVPGDVPVTDQKSESESEESSSSVHTFNDASGDDDERILAAGRCYAVSVVQRMTASGKPPMHEAPYVASTAKDWVARNRGRATDALARTPTCTPDQLVKICADSYVPPPASRPNCDVCQNTGMVYDDNVEAAVRCACNPQLEGQLA